MPERYDPATLFNGLKNIFNPDQHHNVLLTGGAARDIINGIRPLDIDLITDISPAGLTEIGFHRVEASNSNVIFLQHHPELGKLEVTRIDDINKLNHELERRDFTVNAIAMSLDGLCHDPLCGQADLKKRLLRTPLASTFMDDPLRIFRAFRFECSSLVMDYETEQLISKGSWQTALSTMPIERFSNEMLKALTQKQPDIFFKRMIGLDIGRNFLPELFKMFHIPAGPPQHHPEGSLFNHSLQVLQLVSEWTDCPMTRFCAFFHDIGKLATAPELYPKHHGHDAAGFGLAVDFCTRLALSANYRKALAWTSKLHGKMNLWNNLRSATKLSLAEQAFKAGLTEILPLISSADKGENKQLPPDWGDAISIAMMSARELGVDIDRLKSVSVGKRQNYILQSRVALFNKHSGKGTSLT